MAVAPLFVADMDTLKLDLRLQGLRSGSEGESILERATSGARVFFYQRLGPTIVSEMVSTTDVDNPTTTKAIRRKAASLAEVEVVRCSLLETMPVLVGDASASAMQNYNDEGVWRQVEPTERAGILERCRRRVEELLELILAEDDLGDDSTIRVFDGSRADDDRRFPAGTAFPAIGHFPGNFEWGYHAGAGKVEVRFELPEDDS